MLILSLSLAGCVSTDPSTVVYDNPLSSENINSLNQDKLEKAHKLRILDQDRDVEILFDELDNADFVNYFLYKIDNYTYSYTDTTLGGRGKIPHTGCIIPFDAKKSSYPFDKLVEKDIRPYQFKDILCNMKRKGFMRNYVGGNAAERLIYKKDPLALALNTTYATGYFERGGNQLRRNQYYDDDVPSANKWSQEAVLSMYDKTLDSLIAYANSNAEKETAFEELYRMNMCVGGGLRLTLGQCTQYQNKIIKELQYKINIRDLIVYVPKALFNDGISKNIDSLNHILPKIYVVIDLYEDSDSLKLSIDNIQKKIKEYELIMK